jgi:hypothetical protein
MKYLKVFTDFEEAIEPINDAEAGRLFRAMLKYARTGETPQFSGNERYVWPTAKLHIDREAAFCEKQRRNASKPNEAKPSQTKPNEAKPSQISQKDKDKEKDNDKERIDTLTLKGSGISPGESPFDAFWRAYPRKTGKGDARNKFAKALTKTTFETIMTALERVKGSAQWQRDGGQYIPYPATWLNQERWDDDPSAAGGSADGGDNLRHLAALFAEEE